MGLRSQSPDTTMGQDFPCDSSGALASPVFGNEVALAEHSRGNLSPPAASQY
jgi:hypothetical protein